MAVASLFEDLLDQYKIEQHVAEKRYTDLFQAYDVDDDRLVRLDVLRAGFAEDPTFAGRFVNRARALAQVRHSNIAPVLHIGKTSEGVPYVAQGAIDGYPLSYRLDQLAQRNTPANPIYALKLIRQLADALILAERLEIFHYDLQPDNVLLKNVTLPTDDSVVLIDLFIPAERSARASHSGVAAQSSAYLSPEQRAGREVTAAAHVYSLGAMLFRLLAGKVPSGPVTMRDTFVARVLGRATALERERGDLSFATYALVERSLRKDPRGRFSTIESFVEALDGALAAEEVRLGSAAGRAQAAERRPLVWFLPLLALVLLLAVGGVAARNLIDRGVSLGEVIASPEAGQETVAVSAPQTATAPPTRGTTQQPSATVAAVDVVAPPVDATATPTAPAATHTPEPSPTATATSGVTPTPDALASPEPPLVRVMFNLVNLRRGPGVVYPLQGSVAGGELLEVLAWNDDEENPWFLILTEEGRIGWIAATVVQAVSEEALAAVPVAATVPPTPQPAFTATPTPTVVLVFTLTPTLDSGDPGGGSGGGIEPPQEPTDAPTEPAEEPTLTPPPLPEETQAP